MIIAVLSDAHDNIWNLADALEKVKAAGAEALIFCGDFCAPFTLTQIGKGFAGPVHCVFGNNDGDPFLLLRNASVVGNVTLHGHYAELTLGGRRIAVNHYPEIARRLAESGEFRSRMLRSQSPGQGRDGREHGAGQPRRSDGPIRLANVWSIQL